ncbi:hypothetical protein IA868_01530 [Listeria welshimeri]|uniref:T7SS effector LXG polymorphic toxin n=1 Tax=Listeria welshimeri TaxID=1643 RepID=UPI001626B36C|nr:T7SS effector LXG polymorphic toxin [Listeria welshimeri]MBC2006506.1 hypothetical protein [Listeria welshimeri]MBF2471840.1 hypothetical protein [Listeria welshimeri]
MSVNMFLESADGQVTAIKNMCQMHISEMEAVKKAIAQFTAETALKGQAYDSAKQFFEAVYVPLANGFILIVETLQKAAMKMVDEYRTEVDGNSLQEEALRNQIHQLANLIEESTICFAPPATDLSANGISANPFLPFYEDQKRDIQKKLDKLMAYDGVSATLFAEVEGLIVSVEAGLKEVGSGKAFNTNTGLFSISSLNMNWANNIIASRRQQATSEITSIMMNYPNLTDAQLDTLIAIMQNNPDITVPEDLKNKILNIFSTAGDAIGQGVTYLKNELNFGDILLTISQSFGGAVVKYSGRIGIAGPGGPGNFVMLSPQAVQASRWGAGLVKNTIRASWVLAGVTTLIGIHDDMENNDKSLGQAVTHNVVGTGVAIGSSVLVGILVSSNPIGWGFAAGVLVGAGFNWAYDNNFLGLQDGLDWAGDRLDDGLHWAGDRIGERVDLAKEKLEDMGEAISGTFSSINPFD